MNEPTESNTQRRSTILTAAASVFARYGYKKTSMDDVARAAGLSRQGLYLHFANKELLFKAVVQHVIDSTREEGRVSLSRTEATAEERLLGAFEAMHAHLIGHTGAEHLNELMIAASELLSEEFAAYEQAFVADVAKLLRGEGIAERWKPAGVSAKDLAQTLIAASNGAKQKARTVAEYLETIRVAVKMVCRGRG